VYAHNDSVPGGERDVQVPRLADRLAVVGGLKRGDLLRARLDELRELVEEASSVAGAGARPLALEGAARGGDGLVHVGLIGLGHLGERLPRRRVRRREGLAGLRVHPLAVNEELVLARRLGRLALR
jgi:hypothetical protein